MFGIERKTARGEKHLNGKLNLNLLFQQHQTSMLKVSFSVNIYFRLLHPEFMSSAYTESTATMPCELK